MEIVTMYRLVKLVIKEKKKRKKMTLSDSWNSYKDWRACPKRQVNHQSCSLLPTHLQRKDSGNFFLTWIEIKC